MGKNNFDENRIDQLDDTSKISDGVDNKYPKKEKKYTPGKVTVVSRVNRPKNFPVGRGYYYFDPYESKEVPKDVVEHPDFQQQIKDFIVKE